VADAVFQAAGKADAAIAKILEKAKRAFLNRRHRAAAAPVSKASIEDRRFSRDPDHNGAHGWIGEYARFFFGANNHEFSPEVATCTPPPTASPTATTAGK
jgi:hypothetical protein